MTLSQLYVTLLRLSLFGGEAPDGTLFELTEETLSRVCHLAKSQDMGHLVFNALQTYYPHLQNEVVSTLRQQYMTAIFRNECMEADLKDICGVLEKNAIPHIPLKGAVIRPYYKERWMRTSCDIDLLVKEEDLEHAQALIVNELRFKVANAPRFHDVSLYSPAGTHLELHFSLKEGMAPIDRVLDRVWDHASPSENSACHFNLSHEFLLFHLTAHSAYHFLGGGCGTKPVVDLYLLTKKLPYDETALRSLLEESGLLTFYTHLRSLGEVWFENAPHTPEAKKLTQYILKGGVYGSRESSITVKQTKKGGKWRYLLSRLFPPYTSLKLRYPVLESHPILTPFCYVWRLITALLPHRIHRTAKELNTSQSISREKSTDMAEFLKEIGL